MWTNILIGILSSQLTKDVVIKLLDAIANSMKNKVSISDVSKLKDIL